MLRPLYARMAARLQAIETCKRTGNTEYLAKHSENLRTLANQSLPHGSGLDGRVALDIERSKPERLVIVAEFHHMTEDGYYDGWTRHDVIVTPSLASGCNVRVTGRNRDDIKEYLGDIFHQALTEESEATY